MGRVIGIVGGKGGVGKTTIALNLGAALAKTFKKNVAVVDCNIATSHLGLSLGVYYWPNHLNNVLKGEVAVKDALLRHSSGMNVLPASMRLKDMDGVDLTQLKRNVNALAKDHDVVLLDYGPGLERESVMTMGAADEVLFVATPHVPAVVDVVRMHDFTAKLDKKPIGVVVNMAHKQRHELTRKEVETLTSLPVIAHIPFDMHVQRSLAAESPTVIFAPDSPSSREFNRLAASILGVEYAPRTGAWDSFLGMIGIRR